MTRTLLIAYDLAARNDNAACLTDAITRLGEAWARPLDSVWMVRTTLAAEAIEARLAPLLGEDDGLMVQEARGNSALSNTSVRWFRPRRSRALEALETAAVVAFPVAKDEADDLEKAA